MRAIRSPRQGPPPSVLIEESEAINEATGPTPSMYTSVVLAAWRGHEARALELIEASIEDATASGESTAISRAEYARALLYNGLSRYEEALVAAKRACEHDDRGLSVWTHAELVEAGARSGSPDLAGAALQRLEPITRATDTDWARGIEARSRALLSDGQDADALHREALDWLASSHSALHLARAQVLYGEWLRRDGRRVDARRQLRPAHGTFSRIGADGFAERARRELLGTGETARKRTVETRDQLTAQEGQIAQLASEGYTNPEIAARLFISPRTVEWHLHKVFMKLGIASRKELRGGFPAVERAAVPV
jgi:DNA-binding CsgD family transcriptional regulator